jgi:signal transduction histidine kinase
MVRIKKFTTIKRQLLLLVLTAILPIFLFSTYLLGYVAFQHMKAMDMSLKGTARALSSGVEEQITSIISSLRILAVVEDFDEANLKDLHRRLKRFVANQDGWSSIGLSSLDGTQTMSTYTEYGVELQPWNDQPFFKELLRTQKAAISGFRIGRTSGQKLFSVAVPVKVKGQLKFILVASVLTEMLAQKLRDQKFPSSWTASIIDQNNVILARSRMHEKYSGVPATKVLAQKIDADSESFFEDVNHEGVKSYGAFSKHQTTGWTVVLSMPYAEGQFPSIRILWILIIGGCTLLIIGIVLSQIISHKISQPVIALSAAARSLGKGEKPETVVSDLAEINEVAFALENAAKERDRADAIAKELYTKAQEAIELRDNFLSVASHELKTPLTTINLQAQLIRKVVFDQEKFSPEKLDSSISRILKQLRRLTHLIDDLLDISRITAGHLEIHKEVIDLNELTREIIQQFEVDNRGSELLFNSPGEVLGRFDRNRMEQVITNLISNAIKYGKGNPVEINLSTSEGFAVVRIKDNGIGIESKDHSRIFVRFERIVKSSDISGLGLGLWIVKRIVDQLNGSISVESEGLNKGSTFTLTIPTELT